VANRRGQYTNRLVRSCAPTMKHCSGDGRFGAERIEYHAFACRLVGAIQLALSVTVSIFMSRPVRHPGGSHTTPVISLFYSKDLLVKSLPRSYKLVWHDDPGGDRWLSRRRNLTCHSRMVRPLRLTTRSAVDVQHHHPGEPVGSIPLSISESDIPHHAGLNPKVEPKGS